MLPNCLQDKPIGDSCGTYKKQQLFQTKKNHGQFIPLISLVKAEDFFGSPAAGTVPLSKYLHIHCETKSLTLIDGSCHK
jgi:hypothetical protein